MIINDKAADLCKENTKWEIYSGAFTLIAAGFVLLINNTYTGLAGFIVCIGVFLMWSGANKLVRIRRFDMFKEFIGEKNEVRISDMARYSQSDEEIVIGDLMWMMEHGFFEDVEITRGNEFFRSKTNKNWQVSTFYSSTTVVGPDADVLNKQ